MSSVEGRLRLLDANLNRASEGLRVAEDVCRLHWCLPGFAAELKELRHRLLAVGERTAGSRQALLRARDIEGDVGRDSELESLEPGSVDLDEVAHRNLQRVSEAVRVLEEVTRTEDAAARRDLQSIRYAVYAVEKGLGGLRGDAAGGDAAQDDRLAAARLYLLATGSLCRGDLISTVQRALDAGVDIVQLREKTLAGPQLLERARAVREVTARAGALFIVNDRPDVALLTHADGVHLGQGDLPLPEVRSLMGPARIIGVSTHSVEDARRAVRQGADYIGVGPMFETTTKDAGPIFGPRGLESVLAEISRPAFAIGGIDPSNVGELREAGAARIAVSSAVLGSEDPAGVVEELRAALD
jgi:thiamine-phosphate pyrophosphorylase